MNKISIDLDAVRFYNMTLEQMDEEFKKMSEYGIEAINMEYNIFLDEYLEMFMNNILQCIKYNNMQVILRSRPIDGYYTEYIDDEQYQKSIVKHKQFLYNLYKVLEENGIKQGVKVIFSGSKCEDNETQKYIDKHVWFFKELASSVLNMGIEILIEVQGAKPTRGRVVGDTWSDFEYMADEIPNINWGICWSTANSRLNFVEYDDQLIPSKKILDKVKLANIRNNVSQNFDISIYKNEVQEQEIKALVISEYTGMFNLEYIYVQLEYNDIPYYEVFDGIYYLKCVLNYFEKKNKDGGLLIIEDIEKMNRQSIRTIIDKEIKVRIPEKELEFSEIEIATHSLKVWDKEYLLFEDNKEFQIEIYYKDEDMLKLNIKFMMIRDETERQGYVFKIIDKVPDVVKKIYKLVYLVD
ncbi:MAG TPA: hypothetical protein DCP90_08915 [Clostridiales bacterium]|nr:MAG: hypothetical protein A2Y22_02685 [Clostridiales bacterium GWD2_32_59]HAN10714.1 hypothetical protein [Clostridiales bacterium]